MSIVAGGAPLAELRLSVIDPATGEVEGDAAAGAAIIQTTCAACHGFDGKALDWGGKGEHAYVGTEANANSWEVLHKIRNAPPEGHGIGNRRRYGSETAVAVDH